VDLRSSGGDFCSKPKRQCELREFVPWLGSPGLVACHWQTAGYNQWTGMTKNPLRLQINEAILACQEKQAEQLTILELEQGSGAFTDYFVMCSGTNPRQVQAIADAVDERLENMGLRVTHQEGYKQAEWVLLDYVDFVVHIFSDKARQFYDLERLWKSAKRMEPADLLAKPKKARAPGAKTAAPRKPRKTKA
jgi:ribosome-associated protein